MNSQTYFYFAYAYATLVLHNAYLIDLHVHFCCIKIA
jgi:hypothetical protein